MKEEKVFLREKFIEFQRRTAELSHMLREQKQAHQNRENALFLDLFEVLDAFENLDDNMAAKEDTFDKTTRMMAKNIRSICKKLIRLLRNNHIVQISFPDNKASMEYCKVLETRELPDMKNETILSVVRNGYMNTERNEVLRKAQVITVRNEEDEL